MAAWRGRASSRAEMHLLLRKHGWKLRYRRRWEISPELGMDSTRMPSADQNSATMASLLDRILEPQIAARVPFEAQRDQAAKRLRELAPQK